MIKRCRLFRVILFLLIMVFSFASCGGGKDDELPKKHTEESKKDKDEKTKNDNGKKETIEVVSKQEDSLLVAKSEEPFDFCTKYKEDYYYEWDENNGITIYTENSGSIPYVLVWNSSNEKMTAQTLLEDDCRDFFFRYGDDLLYTGDITEYSYGDKKLQGVLLRYKLDAYEIECLRLVDESPRKGYVLYTAKYISKSPEGGESEVARMKENTLDALNTAVKYFHTDRDFYEKDFQNGEEYIEVVPSIAKTMQYETYYDSWFNVEIPKGFRVESGSFNNSAAAFTIRVYDPENPDIQFFTALETIWFKSEKDYTKLRNYPLAGDAFDGLPYLISGADPLREMYENFNVFRDSAYGYYVSLPTMNGWREIESFGTTPLGGELIRGSYTNEDGKEIEGIFTGRWANGISMYGYNYPGAFYSPMFYTAPAGEFAEWAEILNYCLNSFAYTESYMDQFYKEESSTMKSFEANTKIYNETSDMIASSWNERQTTYDIASAKSSDATLGYDRIYDTETGEVYRVEVGFMDSYNGTKYESITEDMYSLPISGYIYK